MVEPFEPFFEQWLARLQAILQELLPSTENNDQRCIDLIYQTLTLYCEYFAAIERIARDDVFLVLSPTWLSSFERVLLWIGGFKPSVVFCLIRNNLLDLTDEQSERIGRLTEEVKEEESQLFDEFTRLQEWMETLFLARHLGTLRNGQVSRIDSDVDDFKMRMEALIECANLLRKKVGGILVLEILKPNQALRFLAALATLQLVIRRLGIRRDNEAAH